MPVPYIEKLVNQGKGSKEELEKKWGAAKREAEKQGHKDDYDYITAIFKKMAGIKESLYLKDFMILAELSLVRPKAGSVKREDMPQIESKDLDELYDFLKSKGVKLRKVKVPVGDLHAIQSEFADAGIIRSIENKKNAKKPILISHDNYVLDGNHRWLAKLNVDSKSKIDAIMLSVDVMPALKLLKSFPKTIYKSAKDNKVISK